MIQWDSLKSETTILERCKELNPDSSQVRTLLEMLWGVDFYQNALYHHEYGQMINSAQFSGTPGDVAVQRVIEWLEEHGKGNARGDH